MQADSTRTSEPSPATQKHDAGRVLIVDNEAMLLRALKQILTQHYPDCPPLRALMKKLDAAIGSMQTWAS